MTSPHDTTKQPIPIWNVHDGGGNVMLLPQLRGGCHRWRPGWHGRKHSHDGAVEVFFVVDGACDFDVDSQLFTLRSGQYVLIPPEVPHELWNRTPHDLLMFLVVAPHQQPTHTYYDDSNQPIRKQPSLA